MAFVNVEEAVGLALLGIDPTTVNTARAVARGTDLGGQHRGFKVAAFDGQAGQLARGPLHIGTRQVSYGGIRTEIPVFSVRGRRNVETYPSVSYELVGFAFAPERYIWKADTFRTPVEASITRVIYEGRELVGPQLLRVRDNPEPYDLTFQIDLWASSDAEALTLQRLVLETFPARGALRAVQEDGTPYSWEMALQGVDQASDEEPTLEDQDRVSSHWVYTYDVESFLDNTQVTSLRRTVTAIDFEQEAI